ncbi:MAG: hypothetical protein M1840_007866 [Geoglossum simile]|nr:MAG: hypothetical protein M1840_007866 [Geoglossum simile]
MAPFVQYGLPQSVAYPNGPSGPRHSAPNPLIECRRQRVPGNFEAVIKGLQIINAGYLERRLPNVEVCLEFQLAFLEQGYFREALACTSLLRPATCRGERDLPTMIFVVMCLATADAMPWTRNCHGNVVAVMTATPRTQHWICDAAIGVETAMSLIGRITELRALLGNSGVARRMSITRSGAS